MYRPNDVGGQGNYILQIAQHIVGGEGHWLLLEDG